MSAVSATSSDRPYGILRCVDRCCPRHTAGEALRHLKRLHDVGHAATAAGGAQHFPDATSFRMSFPRVRSDTAFRSRSFSFSSSFKRLT